MSTSPRSPYSPDHAQQLKQPAPRLLLGQPHGYPAKPQQALPTCTPGEAQPVARRKAPTAHCRYSAWRDALRGRPSRSAGSST